jgi:ubiquinone biosynthesis monooxygenase Coq7
MVEPQTLTKPKYDISIIRPAMRSSDIKLRGEGFGPARLATIRKGLRILHTLELMAQTIYRFQITPERSETNRRLIAAMCNEMGHYQDCQVALLEYGFRPSLLRGVFWARRQSCEPASGSSPKPSVTTPSC